MPKKVRLPIALVLALVLALGIAGAPSAAKMAFETTGPHVDEIIMPIIKDQQARRIAFERGESVVWSGLTQPDDIDRAKAMPNSDMTMTLGFHMFYLCFNMREEPLSNQPIRQAIAHCVDRDNIIRTLFKGYMLPMTSFVPQVSPFYKADVPVYPFNHAKAAEVLDKAGYKLDPATNVRIDPKTGKPLAEMKIFTPTYEVAATSAELGKMIADSCQKVGLPVVPEPMDFPVMLDKIDIHEFDMYVLAWGLSRNPDFLYSFFHSSQDVEAGYNNPGMRNPEYDKQSERLNYAADLKEAKAASDACQLILAREMPYVPLYSRPYIDAFRKDLVTGYVPMMGFGAASYNNQWTTLNMRRVDRRGNAIEGGTIRWTLQEEPKNLNPCVASSAYEQEVISRLYDGLMAMHPETLDDMPWMARKWDVGVWEPEPGVKGTTVTWYLEKGIKWSDGMPFTAEDVEFTINYLKENKVPRYLPATQDIVKAELIDRYTVKVYFANVSYWHIYNAGLAFLPKHIWKDVKDWKGFEPWKEAHPKIKGYSKLVGTGPFILKDYVPGEYVRLVKNPNYWRLNK
ncbi:MAG: ABC transporter substrate-binding protein [Firmicutes bacterium]|jgi:peptide/nickel transport system substrate-binding protein|nr:ABC transporter substrate-binding protein [Bacillota bacterium]MDD4337178.1 ABC transporter substrate-binding protein [Bacillota bacterium]MDD4792011.1 ABC transporter substrate-binding protein [Bacillota bacterium]